MSKQEINSNEYIEDILRVKSVKEMLIAQQPKLTTSIKIGFKVIFYSKKWMIYLALSFINLIVYLLIEGLDASFKHPVDAFLGVLFRELFPFIFIFGCLLISLPLSADEISDHSIEMYLVRPIKRETYWLSRWIVITIFVYSINIIIYFIYFIYFHAFAAQGMFFNITENLHVFGRIAIFLIPASLIYSGLFLLVGMIGNRSFVLGLLLTVFDLLLLSLLFLYNSPLIPQTNLKKIAEGLLPMHLNFSTPKDLKLWGAWLYILIASSIIFFCGAFYLRIREIK